MTVKAATIDERILVLAPTGRDAALTADVIRESNLAPTVVLSVQHLCDELAYGAGAIVLAEEALSDLAIDCLNLALARQPAWSEIPIILLTSGGMTTRSSARTAKMLEPRANVTLMERPVRVLTLISAVHSAVRARKRQLEVRDLLAEKDATVRRQADDVRRRDEFLAMLGHELRNPLATIRNAVELLEQEADDPATAAEHRAIIERQATHLAQLVDDLLDVSRITMGKILLRRTPVDVADVVRRAAESVRPTIAGQQQSLTVRVGGRPLIVEGDPVRIEQVVLNLLTNANKYTPAGGRIELSADVERGQVVVRVRDSGIGISPEMLPRVFEPFSQADTSLHRSKGGLGIGLTVVKRLVEMQGGSVSVTSDGEGRGSEFVVRLPLRPDLHVAAPAATERPRTTRRVLLVEDAPDARKVMAALLERWGHDVAHAADGAVALEVAPGHRPEVALVDIGLPGMDGYAVAKGLREKLGHRVVLVALTGYGQPEDRERALRAGFDLHLVKPVQPELLARVLAESEPGRPYRHATGDGSVS
jgi:signal transduction histidine kinase/CheY-like chemotaxis protein